MRWLPLCNKKLSTFHSGYFYYRSVFICNSICFQCIKKLVDYLQHCVFLQVVDMCLATIPTAHKDATLGLYNHWYKMFPDNKILVCRSVPML